MSQSPTLSPTAAATRATIVPALRYRDARRAIAFLCDGLGFTRHAVHEGEGGAIVHAELGFGNGMVMLGEVANSAYGRETVQPNEVGTRETQSPYLIVADADAVYAMARAAGFSIVIDIKDEDYCGRGFTCRDPEGHMWSIGTYDPWKAG